MITGEACALLHEGSPQCRLRRLSTRALQVSFSLGSYVRAGLYVGVNCILRLLGVVLVQKSLDSGPVVRVDVSEILDRFPLNEKLSIFQVVGNVLTQAFPLLLIQHLRIECPHLSDVVFISTVEALHICRALAMVLQGRALLLWCAEAVGVVVGSTTLVVMHAHGAIALVVGHASTVGTVHRYLQIVWSQAVAVSVWVSKKAALQ